MTLPHIFDLLRGRPREEIRAFLTTPAHSPTKEMVMFYQQGGRCFYCERNLADPKLEPKSPRRITFDHIVPHCEGGGRVAENGVAACAECNAERGHMPAHDYKLVWHFRLSQTTLR